MKKTAGILVNQRNLEALCVNTLNKKNLSVTVFSDSKSLFQSLIDEHLHLLIIDSSIETETVDMIERYRMLRPQLYIIVLGENANMQGQFIEIGCNVYTHEQGLAHQLKILEIDHLPQHHTYDELIDMWRLSNVDYHLYTPCHQKIKLTVREFKFLKLLFESEKVLSKNMIKEHVIGGDYFTSDHRIALLVARLRKKVNTESVHDLPIKPDYTNGYLFAGRCIVKHPTPKRL